MLAKSSVLFVFSYDSNKDDHGVLQTDRVQALAQWRHILDSHEATDTLHRVMCLTLYLPGGTVVPIAIDSGTFNYIVVVKLN